MIIRMLLSLLDNKAIYRNKEKKEEVERDLRIDKEGREDENLGCWEKTKNFFKDATSLFMVKIKYLLIPMLIILPSVSFRLGTLWLLFTYSSEWFLNEAGDGPGYGLSLPLVLMLIIIGINYLVATKHLALNEKEALVNAITTSILPTFVHLNFLV